MRYLYLLIGLLMGLEGMAQEVRVENGAAKGDVYIVDCVANKSGEDIRYHVELQFLVGENPQLVVPEKVAGKRAWLRPGERVKMSWNFGDELREDIDPATIQPILIYTTEVFEGSPLKPSHKWIPAKGHQVIGNGGASHAALTYGSYLLAGGAAVSQVFSMQQEGNYTTLIDDTYADWSNGSISVEEKKEAYDEARKHFDNAKTLQYGAIGAAGLAVIFWTLDRLALNKANKKMQQPLIDFDEAVSYEPILYFYQHRGLGMTGVELGVRVRF